MLSFKMEIAINRYRELKKIIDILILNNISYIIIRYYLVPFIIDNDINEYYYGYIAGYPQKYLISFPYKSLIDKFNQNEINNIINFLYSFSIEDFEDFINYCNKHNYKRNKLHYQSCSLINFNSYTQIFSILFMI